MKMRAIHKRTKSFNNKKGKSPRKEKKASMFRWMMKEMTSSMTNSITLGKSSFKIRKKIFLKMNKRQICRNKFKN
jgi:hypothetical protein